MGTIEGNIQQRYDTAANFAASNRVLLAGEKAIESDTLKEKVGNGTTAYNALPYSVNLPAFTAHAVDTTNPHNVTKAQVGLGNVTNTADGNKPVSTAQQTALDLKANAGTRATGHIQFITGQSAEITLNGAVINTQSGSPEAARDSTLADLQASDDESLTVAEYEARETNGIAEILVTYKTYGVEGNSFTMVTGDSNRIAISGETLTGGTDGVNKILANFERRISILEGN